ncbi:MipA/OmpV family protein [Roseateles cellulosilyticus]|uniref:MipA/OmpV family protein n=1 Tax=Pelomonas cellulosilytica TaxID=2906762 RepID=A0ABS8XYP1_9BURK|nr:MipA/OmpV family protein [Pelomonas sp. P8]MCE4555957.1 MipA/OmpV family protein [Pelomonas sp. P8]
MRPARLLSTLALACTAAAQAEPPAAETPPVRYLLGVGVVSQPEYDGSGARQNKLKPLWAVRFGRVRISTSGAGGLLGFGQEESAGGASTQFVDNEKVRAGIALRVDSGRKSGDAGTTRGLPDVKRTLRARLYASYSLTRDLTLNGSLSQDLIGRRGGMTLGADVGWRFYRSPTLEWTTGFGVSAGNAQNLRSYFGVPESAVEASGKPAYEPGAGLRDVHAGIGFIRPITKHWLAYGSVGASRLLGPAADSPLTQNLSGYSAAVGIAWRN